jgi:hypothetical protein
LALKQEEQKEEGNGGKDSEKGTEREEASCGRAKRMYSSDDGSGTGDGSESLAGTRQGGYDMVAVKIEKGEDVKVKQKGYEDDSIDTEVSEKKCTLQVMITADTVL